MSNKLEKLSLIWFITRALTIGVTITSTLEISKTLSIFSFIISYLIGLFILHIYNHKDITQNKFYNNILIIIIYILALITLKDLSYFINSQFLFKTDHLVLSLFLLLPPLYALNKGFNSFLRSNQILFFLTFIIIILIITFLVPNIKLDNFKPLKGNIINSLIFIISYNILPLILIRIFDEKIDLKMYSISFLSIIPIIILTIGIFGIELSNILKFPEFQLLKKVSIGSFGSKIESILSLEWLISLYVLLTFCLFSFKKIIQKTYKKQTNNFLICLSLLVLNCIYINNSNLIIYFSYILLIVFLVPLFYNSKNKNTDRNKHNKD